MSKVRIIKRVNLGKLCFMFSDARWVYLEIQGEVYFRLTHQHLNLFVERFNAIFLKTSLKKDRVLQLGKVSRYIPGFSLTGEHVDNFIVVVERKSGRFFSISAFADEDCGRSLFSLLVSPEDWNTFIELIPSKNDRSH